MDSLAALQASEPMTPPQSVIPLSPLGSSFLLAPLLPSIPLALPRSLEPLAPHQSCKLVALPCSVFTVAIISLIGSQQSKYLFQFHPVEDRIHHAGMDGLLRNCATGCRVDEAFTMDDLVDSISADTSGLRCGRVQLRIVFITPVWTVC
ncbi:hypothetical protein DPX16_14361 [Anabarilius grahami]|uniref:Uncharacterized protein n=1 Tax=Anabarilius grahami TaxID=495550 RepID=A0A3N0XPJ9_ANAGA|nr:hypothetical protein DPX16_14361 [Anabarilius grahami]